MLTTERSATVPWAEHPRLYKRLSVELAGSIISDRVKSIVRDVAIEDAVLAVTTGETLRKYTTKKLIPPHERWFQVDLNCYLLRWLSPKKKASESCIPFASVIRVVPGFDSDHWRTKSEESLLGVEIISSVRILKLVCPDFHTWKLWYVGLMFAHKRAISEATANRLKKEWTLAGAALRGELKEAEVQGWLYRLQFPSEAIFAWRFYRENRATTINSEGAVGSDEFKMFVEHLLTHVDIRALFYHYVDLAGPGGGKYMDLDGYRKFLRDSQLESDERIETLVNRVCEMKNPMYYSDTEGLTELGFHECLVNAEWNHVVDFQVEDPMDHPLPHYWICSSHNTYLTQGQLVGKSAVSMYIDILLAGCRCVELDCWDGGDTEDGEALWNSSKVPIIYHGYTLTSKIRFDHVIQAIHDYGFTASDYPLILSLEMHCSVQQRRVIGDILRTILGSALITASEFLKSARTPESLKRRVIVKCRAPSDSSSQLSESDDDGDEEEDAEGGEMDQDFAAASLKKLFPSGLTSRMESNAVVVWAGDTKYRDVTVAHGRSFLAKDKQAAALSKYHDCIAMKNRKLKEFDDPERAEWHCSSFPEKEITRYEKAAKRLVLWHQSYLSRMYPSGKRFLSTNYNPVPAWNLGCQMVALNWQARGAATLLNMGKFFANKRRGYVLKPRILRDPVIEFNPLDFDSERLKNLGVEIPLKLTIQILGGQQLITWKNGARDGGEQIAHLIAHVSIFGVPKDVRSYKTDPAPCTPDSLNVRWISQTFEFTVLVPSLALLCIEVQSLGRRGASELVGGIAAPLNRLMRGIRWCPIAQSGLDYGRPCNRSGLLVQIDTQTL